MWETCREEAPARQTAVRNEEDGFLQRTKYKKTPPRPFPNHNKAMARYMIQTPHKAEECLRPLDEELNKGKDILDKVEFGCSAGDHTGYALVDANNKNEALNKYVPSFIQDRAQVVEVGKFTPEMIRSFHTKAA
jgi:hypothetical protein